MMPTLGAWAVFRGGLLVGLSNPKLLLFAAAFLPQFVDPSRGQAFQYSVLVATFAACELFWYVWRSRWPWLCAAGWPNPLRDAGSSGWSVACSLPSRCCAFVRDSRRARGLFTTAASVTAQPDHPVRSPRRERFDMIKWAIIFAIIGVIAGVLGFGGIAGASVGTPSPVLGRHHHRRGAVPARHDRGQEGQLALIAQQP